MTVDIGVYRDIEGALEKIGTLGNIDAATGVPVFSYDSSYLLSPGARALSFSLPLRSDPFCEDEFKPYFKGLLPEGPALSGLSSELGLAEEDYLGLLARCGLDCIGDVVVNPEAYRGQRSYRPVSIDALANMANRPSEADRLAETSRLSLAGTQGKVGLYRCGSHDAGEEWFQPFGGAPSNCIVKFARGSLSDLMLVEYLCLSTARMCGVDVPAIDLLDLKAPALCIERYDRLLPTDDVIDGLVVPRRLHQEDFSQVFGVLPGSKYAELEPDTITALVGFLRKRSAYPARDIESLARITLFNYLIGNCDNHLKNLSILYDPDWNSASLAPAYDLVCTTYYTRFSRRMGMRVGNASMIDDVSVDDFALHAKRLGVSPKRLKALARMMLSRVAPALHAAAESLVERGFLEAPYVADDLEEDMAPRAEILGLL